MHNNSFQLYSHQQVGRLSLYILLLMKGSDVHFKLELILGDCLSGNQVPIPLQQAAVSEQDCCPTTFTNSP